MSGWGDFVCRRSQLTPCCSRSSFFSFLLEDRSGLNAKLHAFLYGEQRCAKQVKRDGDFLASQQQSSLKRPKLIRSDTLPGSFFFVPFSPFQLGAAEKSCRGAHGTVVTLGGGWKGICSLGVLPQFAFSTD